MQSFKETSCENDSNHQKLDERKMVQMLSLKKSYPSQYRQFIWKTLLKIPNNYASYMSLVGKDLHLLDVNIGQLPKIDKHMGKVIHRISSAVHICNCDDSNRLSIISSLLSPFVNYFHGSYHMSIEICLTLFRNWFCVFFKDYPNRSTSVFKEIKKIISNKNPQLLDHFSKLQYDYEDVIWKMLSTAFSSRFNFEKWSKLWDHIISNHPSFILCVIVSYFTSLPKLLKCSSCSQIEDLLNQRDSTCINKFLDEAHIMKRNIENNQEIYSKFQPLMQDYSSIVISANLTESSPLEQHIVSNETILEKNICCLCDQSRGNNPSKRLAPFGKENFENYEKTKTAASEGIQVLDIDLKCNTLKHDIGKLSVQVSESIKKETENLLRSFNMSKTDTPPEILDAISKSHKLRMKIAHRKANLKY